MVAVSNFAREPHREDVHTSETVVFRTLMQERTTNLKKTIQARPQVVISRQSSKKFGLHNDPCLRKISRCKNPTLFRSPVRNELVHCLRGAWPRRRMPADTWADTTTPHGPLMLTVLGGLARRISRRMKR